MSKRSPNFRLVKIHRSYTVEEVARLFSCHRNTVRNWQRNGLNPMDDHRPALFDGKTLADFLQARRSARKQSLQPGEMFCLPCRSAKTPAGNMAEYVALTNTHGNLRGICPSCNRLMHRATNYRQIETIGGNLDITFSEAAARIRETSAPSSNCA